jgi:hypothetical protein
LFATSTNQHDQTQSENPFIEKFCNRFHFFKNAMNKSIGSGENVVVVFVGHFAHRLKIRE